MLKLAIISVEAAQKERGDSWYSVFGAVRVPPKGPLIILFDPSVRFKNSSTALLQIRIKYNAGGLTKIYRLIGIWGNIWQQPRRLYANNSTTSANISNVTDTHKGFDENFRSNLQLMCSAQNTFPVHLSQGIRPAIWKGKERRHSCVMLVPNCFTNVLVTLNERQWPF